MTEDQLEQEVLGWLAEIGYTPINGYDIAPDGPAAERADYVQPLLLERLKTAIARLNPHIPLVARDDAIAQLKELGIPALLSANRRFHNLLLGDLAAGELRDVRADELTALLALSDNIQPEA